MSANPHRNDHRAVQYLRGLAELLEARGLETELRHPEGRVPSLRITALDVAHMSELVVVDQGVSGDWFLYSWADRITRVDQIEQTAERIAHVLGAEDDGA